MASPPLLQLRKKETAILVQTASGHALLDPYTTLLGPGIPLPWKIKCSSMPRGIPYDGLPAASTSTPPTKRRKVGREISHNEQANIDLHAELREWLPQAISEVRQARIDGGATTWYNADRITLPNSGQDDVERPPVDLVAWGKEVDEIKSLQGEAEQAADHVIDLAGSRSSEPMTGLFENIHLNAQDSMHIIKTPAASYLVPPRSGLLMADMTKWHRILSTFVTAHHFNVVMLDPPWRSKSVRRSGNYEEMDMYDLYKIRLPELLRESAKNHPVLVGVWVTNHIKCRRFVRDKLLPSWGVRGIVNWYWVKVTAGERGKETETGALPVWRFEGPSPRRCYEGLMLGYYNPDDLTVQRELPDRKGFLSVPLEHSRKPLMMDLLRPYIYGQGERVLELFARYTPDGGGSEDLWVSVGNEPLKYNEGGAHWTKGNE